MIVSLRVSRDRRHLHSRRNTDSMTRGVNDKKSEAFSSAKEKDKGLNEGEEESDSSSFTITMARRRPPRATTVESASSDAGYSSAVSTDSYEGFQHVESHSTTKQQFRSSREGSSDREPTLPPYPSQPSDRTREQSIGKGDMITHSDNEAHQPGPGAASLKDIKTLNLAPSDGINLDELIAKTREEQQVRDQPKNGQGKAKMKERLEASPPSQSMGMPTIPQSVVDMLEAQTIGSPSVQDKANLAPRRHPTWSTPMQASLHQIPKESNSLIREDICENFTLQHPFPIPVFSKDQHSAFNASVPQNRHASSPQMPLPQLQVMSLPVISQPEARPFPSMPVAQVELQPPMPVPEAIRPNFKPVAELPSVPVAEVDRPLSMPIPDDPSNILSKLPFTNKRARTQTFPPPQMPVPEIPPSMPVANLPSDPFLSRIEPHHEPFTESMPELVERPSFPPMPLPGILNESQLPIPNQFMAARQHAETHFPIVGQSPISEQLSVSVPVPMPVPILPQKKPSQTDKEANRFQMKSVDADKKVTIQHSPTRPGISYMPLKMPAPDIPSSRLDASSISLGEARKSKREKGDVVRPLPTANAKMPVASFSAEATPVSRTSTVLPGKQIEMPIPTWQWPPSVVLQNGHEDHYGQDGPASASSVTTDFSSSASTDTTLPPNPTDKERIRYQSKLIVRELLASVPHSLLKKLAPEQLGDMLKKTLKNEGSPRSHSPSSLSTSALDATQEGIETSGQERAMLKRNRQAGQEEDDVSTVKGEFRSTFGQAEGIIPMPEPQLPRQTFDIAMLGSPSFPLPYIPQELLYLPLSVPSQPQSIYVQGPQSHALPSPCSHAFYRLPELQPFEGLPLLPPPSVGDYFVSSHHPASEAQRPPLDDEYRLHLHSLEEKTHAEEHFAHPQPGTLLSYPINFGLDEGLQWQHETTSQPYADSACLPPQSDENAKSRPDILNSEEEGPRHQKGPLDPVAPVADSSRWTSLENPFWLY